MDVFIGRNKISFLIGFFQLSFIFRSHRANGYKVFDIYLERAKQQFCLFEEIKADSKFDVFAVAIGPTEALLKLSVTTPNGLVGSNGPYSHVEIMRDVKKRDTYSFCVESYVVKVKAKFGLLIQEPIDLNQQHEDRNVSDDSNYWGVSNDALQNFIHTTTRVLWTAAMIYEQVQAINVNLEQDRELLEYALTRVTVWTFIGCCVVVMSSVVQVCFIRHMFSAKPSELLKMRFV